MRVTARKLRSFLTWPLCEQALAAPVFAMLGLARLMTLILPFKAYARVFGPVVAPGAPAPGVDAARRARARAIGRVVRAVAEVTPWRSLCLPQALTAIALMRLCGAAHIAHFGARRRGEDGLAAHVWVLCDTDAVTGVRGSGRFAIVASHCRPH